MELASFFFLQETTKLSKRPNFDYNINQKRGFLGFIILHQLLCLSTFCTVYCELI
jgi:hypothetical protein